MNFERTFKRFTDALRYQVGRLKRLGKKKYVCGDNCWISRRALFDRGSKVTFGNRCRVSPLVIFETQNGNIRLGNNVSVNSHTIMYGHGGISIGNDVRIACHVAIFSADHIFDDPNATTYSQGLRAKETSIGNDVWIGSGAKILYGTVIPDGCVIGANSVVKGTLEPYGVYVGAPARKVKSRLPDGAPGR